MRDKKKAKTTFKQMNSPHLFRISQFRVQRWRCTILQEKEPFRSMISYVASSYVSVSLSFTGLHSLLHLFDRVLCSKVTAG